MSDDITLPAITRKRTYTSFKPIGWGPQFPRAPALQESAVSSGPNLALQGLAGICPCIYAAPVHNYSIYIEVLILTCPRSTHRGIMSLNSLPDGCLQHVLEFLCIRDIAVCAATCKRISTLAKLPLMWIPRLKEDFGVAIKVIWATAP